MRMFLSGLAIGISLVSALAVAVTATQRSSAAVARFERMHPIKNEPKCVNPDGSIRMRQIRDCVVDHVIPLECGGADDPSNMQWQTYTESRVKDRTEAQCK